MNDFLLYLKLGFEHILDPEGYDHILFIFSFCAIYLIKDWKKVLVLVTLFTITHSLSLVLSGLGIVKVDPTLIETLIPLTILSSCVYNIFFFSEEKKNTFWTYIIVPAFGLIHGLGFSNFFSMIMSEDESILLQLLSFNLGIELGQLIVVTISFILLFIFNNLLDLSIKYWRLLVSGIIGLLSLHLILA